MILLPMEMETWGEDYSSGNDIDELAGTLGLARKWSASRLARPARLSRKKRPHLRMDTPREALMSASRDHPGQQRICFAPLTSYFRDMRGFFKCLPRRKWVSLRDLDGITNADLIGNLLLTRCACDGEPMPIESLHVIAKHGCDFTEVNGSISASGVALHPVSLLTSVFVAGAGLERRQHRWLGVRGGVDIHLLLVLRIVVFIF
eukprot:IDg6757t1